MFMHGAELTCCIGIQSEGRCGYTSSKRRWGHYQRHHWVRSEALIYLLTVVQALKSCGRSVSARHKIGPGQGVEGARVHRRETCGVCSMVIPRRFVADIGSQKRSWPVHVIAPRLRTTVNAPVDLVPLKEAGKLCGYNRCRGLLGAKRGKKKTIALPIGGTRLKPCKPNKALVSVAPLPRTALPASSFAAANATARKAAAQRSRWAQ